VPSIAAIQRRLHAHSDGERAAAVELALEALYLAKRIDKVTEEGETVYG
jgi:magnesium chelatase subunit I